MNATPTMRRLLPALALLAACGSPTLCGACGSDGGGDGGSDGGPIDELPAAFRVDAEIVGVDGPVPQSCIPTMADVNPGGPDWQLEFREMQGAAPKVDEVVSSRNGHHLATCGASACCDVVVEIAGGWSVACRTSNDLQAAAFEFSFFLDGTGTSTATLTRRSDGAAICTSVAEWTAIAPL